MRRRKPARRPLQNYNGTHRQIFRADITFTQRFACREMRKAHGDEIRRIKVINR
ncbi:hypothetical protein ACS15_5120 [Ralstonia insidiosa]|uniref:Uncharacterized protein n=1 Tax=Ralstonia insidiosa TaxID=190721 RepID=A0AAC9BK15_9RALS|nr:hypothetical protein ACS15_5120 [Ralstonia insidiosa]